MNCAYCIDHLPVEVTVADIETKCKYHKKEGAVYTQTSIAPPGICRELFFAAYPGCMAVLYSGMPVKKWVRKKGLQKCRAGCTHPEGVNIEISREEIFPAPVRVMKELTEELMKLAYRPFDAHCRRVRITVTDPGSFCPKKYKKGDVFYFNTCKQDELCPAGFAAVYPYIRYLSSPENGRSGSGSVNVHCPDYVGVTYRVSLKT